MSEHNDPKALSALRLLELHTNLRELVSLRSKIVNRLNANLDSEKIVQAMSDAGQMVAAAIRSIDEELNIYSQIDTIGRLLEDTAPKGEPESELQKSLKSLRKL